MRNGACAHFTGRRGTGVTPSAALRRQWLQGISLVNPLSYEVSALRGLLLGTPTTLWLDFVVLVGTALIAIVTASALLGRRTR